MHPSWLLPSWHPRSEIKSLITTRHGGVSVSPYDSMNLAMHVGDDPVHVLANRRLLTMDLPSEPVWLNQVHSTEVVDADLPHALVPVADAAVTTRADCVLAAMTADCLPVLLADDAASVIGIAHAGWRGLAFGVIEATLQLMQLKAPTATRWYAYLGPAIGPKHFEVGPEVKDIFVSRHPQAATAFKAVGSEDKYLANLYALARMRLQLAGVDNIAGGSDCTYANQNFYSYRRDKATGRMASLIWRASQ